MPGPSAVGATASASSRGGRHYLLYARQNWRDMRVILVLYAIGLPAYFGFVGFQHHDLTLALQGLPAIVFAGVIAGLVNLYSRSCWVRVADDGLQVHFPIRRAVVPYTEVEKARLDSLKNLFERPEYKKMATGTVKRLYEKKALCVRLRDEDGLPQVLRKRLGPRTVLDTELVLAITDSDVAYGELKDRLQMRRQRPIEPGAEAAGRRRRGRRGRRR